MVTDPTGIHVKPELGTRPFFSFATKTRRQRNTASKNKKKFGNAIASVSKGSSHNEYTVVIMQ